MVECDCFIAFRIMGDLSSLRHLDDTFEKKRKKHKKIGLSTWQFFTGTPVRAMNYVRKTTRAASMIVALKRNDFSLRFKEKKNRQPQVDYRKKLIGR